MSNLEKYFCVSNSVYVQMPTILHCKWFDTMNYLCIFYVKRNEIKNIIWFLKRAQSTFFCNFKVSGKRRKKLKTSSHCI